MVYINWLLLCTLNGLKWCLLLAGLSNIGSNLPDQVNHNLLFQLFFLHDTLVLYQMPNQPTRILTVQWHDETAPIQDCNHIYVLDRTSLFMLIYEFCLYLKGFTSVRLDINRWLTDALPADSPKIVTWFGSPPKWWIYFLTHLRLITWSRSPILPIAFSESRHMKPEIFKRVILKQIVVANNLWNWELKT